MEGDFIRINEWMRPLSWLYGLGVKFRNMLFEIGILKSESFGIPVISVGNITVGGTGKTPHVEFLVRLLQERFKVAVLSRGYKRRSKGFVLGGKDSTVMSLGDEPYQMMTKYPDITVAVDKNRRHGIHLLTDDNIVKGIDVILLDDAFQHRYVKPSASVILTEYNRPVFMDKLLPYGRLREPARALNRADIVVVTKCPPDMKAMDYRIFEENLKLFPYQKLYFSRYNYGHLVPIFPEEAHDIPALDHQNADTSILVVTGVANPKPFVRFLRRHKAKVKLKRFTDHHNFTSSDMEEIARLYDELQGKNKFIITTEKDAVRILNNPYFPHRLKKSIFYVPIKVEFIDRGEPDFTSGLEKTIRDSRLFKS